MTVDDSKRVEAVARALFPDVETVAVIEVPGRPPTKSRPRFSRKGHAYSSGDTRANEARTAGYLKTKVRTPLDGPLVVTCLFVRDTFQRIDVDNMLKHVCDAANRVLWADDSQVKGVAGMISFDKECPRTIVFLGRAPSAMVRPSENSRTCKQCGKEYRSFYQVRTYCSDACRAKGVASPHAVERTCPVCSTKFPGSAQRHRYCSTECRLQGLHRGKRIHPAAHCGQCGKKLSKPGYVTCRACWLASRGSVAPAHVEDDVDVHRAAHEAATKPVEKVEEAA